MMRLIATLVGVTLLSACTTSLEQRNILRFKADPDPDGATLVVSGLCSGSALAVKRIRTAREGRDLLVDIRIGLARDGESGAFSKKLPLSPEVDRVLLGEERREIWRRNASP